MSFAPEIFDGVRTVKQSIDCKSATSTLLYTPPAGKKLFIDAFRFVANAINTVTGNPVISIGTNSPNYDNVMANTTLSTLTAANKIFRSGPATTYDAITTGLYVKVQTAATATSFTIDIHTKGDIV